MELHPEVLFFELVFLKEILIVKKIKKLFLVLRK